MMQSMQNQKNQIQNQKQIYQNHIGRLERSFAGRRNKLTWLNLPLPSESGHLSDSDKNSLSIPFPEHILGNLPDNPLSAAVTVAYGSNLSEISENQNESQVESDNKNHRYIINEAESELQLYNSEDSNVNVNDINIIGICANKKAFCALLDTRITTPLILWGSKSHGADSNLPKVVQEFINSNSNTSLTSTSSSIHIIKVLALSTGFAVLLNDGTLFIDDNKDNDSITKMENIRDIAVINIVQESDSISKSETEESSENSSDIIFVLDKEDFMWRGARETQNHNVEAQDINQSQSQTQSQLTINCQESQESYLSFHQIDILHGGLVSSYSSFLNPIQGFQTMQSYSINGIPISSAIFFRRSENILSNKNHDQIHDHDANSNMVEESEEKDLDLESQKDNHNQCHIEQSANVVKESDSVVNTDGHIVSAAQNFQSTLDVNQLYHNNLGGTTTRLQQPKGGPIYSISTGYKPPKVRQMFCSKSHLYVLDVNNVLRRCSAEKGQCLVPFPLPSESEVTDKRNSCSKESGIKMVWPRRNFIVMLTTKNTIRVFQDSDLNFITSKEVGIESSHECKELDLPFFLQQPLISNKIGSMLSSEIDEIHNLKSLNHNHNGKLVTNTNSLDDIISSEFTDNINYKTVTTVTNSNVHESKDVKRSAICESESLFSDELTVLETSLYAKIAHLGKIFVWNFREETTSSIQEWSINDVKSIHLVSKSEMYIELVQNLSLSDSDSISKNNLIHIGLNLNAISKSESEYATESDLYKLQSSIVLATEELLSWNRKCNASLKTIDKRSAFSRGPLPCNSNTIKVTELDNEVNDVLTSYTDLNGIHSTYDYPVNSGLISHGTRQNNNSNSVNLNGPGPDKKSRRSLLNSNLGSLTNFQSGNRGNNYVNSMAVNYNPSSFQNASMLATQFENLGLTQIIDKESELSIDSGDDADSERECNKPDNENQKEEEKIIDKEYHSVNNTHQESDSYSISKFNSLSGIQSLNTLPFSNQAQGRLSCTNNSPGPTTTPQSFQGVLTPSQSQQSLSTPTLTSRYLRGINQNHQGACPTLTGSNLRSNSRISQRSMMSDKSMCTNSIQQQCQSLTLTSQHQDPDLTDPLVFQHMSPRMTPRQSHSSANLNPMSMSQSGKKLSQTQLSCQGQLSDDVASLTTVNPVSNFNANTTTGTPTSNITTMNTSVNPDLNDLKVFQHMSPRVTPRHSTMSMGSMTSLNLNGPTNNTNDVTVGPGVASGLFSGVPKKSSSATNMNINKSVASGAVSTPNTPKSSYSINQQLHQQKSMAASEFIPENHQIHHDRTLSDSLSRFNAINNNKSLILNTVNSTGFFNNNSVLSLQFSEGPSWKHTNHIIEDATQMIDDIIGGWLKDKNTDNHIENTEDLDVPSIGQAIAIVDPLHATDLLLPAAKKALHHPIVSEKLQELKSEIIIQNQNENHNDNENVNVDNCKVNIHSETVISILKDAVVEEVINSEMRNQGIIVDSQNLNQIGPREDILSQINSRLESKIQSQLGMQLHSQIVSGHNNVSMLKSGLLEQAEDTNLNITNEQSTVAPGQTGHDSSDHHDTFGTTYDTAYGGYNYSTTYNSFLEHIGGTSGNTNYLNPSLSNRTGGGPNLNKHSNNSTKSNHTLILEASELVGTLVTHLISRWNAGDVEPISTVVMSDSVTGAGPGPGTVGTGGALGNTQGIEEVDSDQERDSEVQVQVEETVEVEEEEEEEEEVQLIVEDSKSDSSDNTISPRKVKEMEQFTLIGKDEEEKESKRKETSSTTSDNCNFDKKASSENHVPSIPSLTKPSQSESMSLSIANLNYSSKILSPIQESDKIDTKSGNNLLTSTATVATVIPPLSSAMGSTNIISSQILDPGSPDSTTVLESNRNSNLNSANVNLINKTTVTSEVLLSVPDQKLMKDSDANDIEPSGVTSVELFNCQLVRNGENHNISLTNNSLQSDGNAITGTGVTTETVGAHQFESNQHLQSHQQFRSLANIGNHLNSETLSDFDPSSTRVNASETIPGLPQTELNVSNASTMAGPGPGIVSGFLSNLWNSAMDSQGPVNVTSHQSQTQSNLNQCHTQNLGIVSTIIEDVNEEESGINEEEVNHINEQEKRDVTVGDDSHTNNDNANDDHYKFVIDNDSRSTQSVLNGSQSGLMRVDTPMPNSRTSEVTTSVTVGRLSVGSSSELLNSSISTSTKRKNFIMGDLRSKPIEENLIDSEESVQDTGRTPKGKQMANNNSDSFIHSNDIKGSFNSLLNSKDPSLNSIDNTNGRRTIKFDPIKSVTVAGQATGTTSVSNSLTNLESETTSDLPERQCASQPVDSTAFRNSTNNFNFKTSSSKFRDNKSWIKNPQSLEKFEADHTLEAYGLNNTVSCDPTGRRFSQAAHMELVNTGPGPLKTVTTQSTANGINIINQTQRLSGTSNQSNTSFQSVATNVNVNMPCNTNSIQNVDGNASNTTNVALPGESLTVTNNLDSRTSTILNNNSNSNQLNLNAGTMSSTGHDVTSNTIQTQSISENKSNNLSGSNVESNLLQEDLD